MNTLIHSDNTWALWAILVGVAALSIWLEQRFRWAAKVTGCVIALISMMLLSNFGVIPTESAVYDTVWDYVVPLAIPLLLFQCNIKRIGRESGRLLLIFLIGSVGTTVGALGGFFLLHNLFPELYKVAAMFTGTYIGCSVNFVAMADTFGASGQMSSQAVVADNLLMALYFFVLIAMPSIAFFRRHYAHPLVDQVEAGQDLPWAIGEVKAGPVLLPQGGGHTDVAPPLPLSEVLRLPHGGAGVHRRGGIEGQESPQPVGVVIVAVGEDGQLHPRQVHPQGSGVLDEPARGRPVQQDAVSPVGQVEGQAVLVEQAGGGGILHQNCDAHGAPPFRFRCGPPAPG